MARPGIIRSARAVDTSWALLDQGTALVASTLSFLLLGRHLAAIGYGAFLGLYALIGPFLAFSQSGIFLATLEHTAREREDPNDVARSCLSITLVSALFFVPLVTGIALRSIDGIPALTIVLLVGAEFVLGGVLLALVGIVQAVEGFAPAARLRMTAAVARSILLVALARTGSLTLGAFAIGQVATVGGVMALALARVGRRQGIPVRPGRIRRGHVRSVFLYGLGIAASSAQSDGDKYVLNLAHYQADAGRYGAAYRLVQIAMLPINALAGATHLSFLHAQGGSDTQARRAARLSLVSLVYAVPAVIGLILIAPWMPKILTRDFAGTTAILRLLAPVVILRGIATFPMNGLMGLGHNRLRTRLLAGNALLAIAMYLALIPAYSWRGALTATLISESLLLSSGWIALALCERTRKRSARQTAHAEQAGADGHLDQA